MAVENSGIRLFQNIPQTQSTTYSRAESSASSTELTMTDFYQLLAAQFKYQDADNPMDTSQMMAQMVQTQMISALTHMTTAINDLSLVNTTTYAVSMVGKDVTVAELDEKGQYTGNQIAGTVSGVALGTKPLIYIDGKSYSLSQVMNIGTTEKAKVPEAEDPDTEAPKTQESEQTEV